MEVSSLQGRVRAVSPCLNVPSPSRTHEDCIAMFSENVKFHAVSQGRFRYVGGELVGVDILLLGFSLSLKLDHRLLVFVFLAAVKVYCVLCVSVYQFT